MRLCRRRLRLLSFRILLLRLWLIWIRPNHLLGLLHGFGVVPESLETAVVSLVELLVRRLSDVAEVRSPFHIAAVSAHVVAVARLGGTRASVEPLALNVEQDCRLRSLYTPPTKWTADEGMP